ncbi:efflux RND transporter permease subunit [Armatimonas rosea]|uniref:Multidrug efflux pump subunit AcrB n=1 Tax=Armatimonas rosea TaxID=685828 RepID=A0A7W9W8Z2_ARMRO|nr:efflux RND transporter permease subunit [Armatimonas rosea]MBB6054064.1 multidrug efflux pump subunit AcrB [Armatimonas rosea]
MNLSRLLERYAKALLFLVLIACVLGVMAIRSVPTSIFPQLDIPRIKILADYGDIPPDMVTAQVTKPLEQALSSVPQIRRIHSVTSRGSAELTADFAWGTPMMETLNLANTRLAEVRPTLPSGVSLRTELMRPTVFPILGLSLTSKQTDLSDLYDYALYTLRPELTKIPGVSEVRIVGGHAREFWVNLDPARLRAHGLSVTQVEESIKASNTVSAVGQFEERYHRFSVLSVNQATDTAGIESVVVSVKDRAAVSVGDLGTVVRGYTPQNIAVSAAGETAVLVNVLRQPDGNTMKIAGDVRATLSRLQASYPAGAKIQYFYDQADLVQEAVSSVGEAILIGGALAAFVLILFLGNFRSAAVVLTVIPASILITFGLLSLFGQTINIMTMGALAVALGLVVDDAIVVVENIYRHMQDGFAAHDAVGRALKEIGPAMGASSLSTIVTFVPLTLLSGITGQFFAPLALTIVLTLTVSLVLAVVIAPILAARWLKTTGNTSTTSGNTSTTSGNASTTSGNASTTPGEHHEESQGRLMQVVSHVFERVLTTVLRNKVSFFVLLIPALFGVFILFTRLETGFMPDMDEGGFVLDYKMPPGTSLTETDRICRQIEEKLAETPEIQAYSRRTGAALGFHLTYPHDGDFLVRLKPHGQRNRAVGAIMDELRDKIHEEVPGVDIEFAQILQDLIGDLAGAPKPIEVRIFGDDIKKLQALAPEVGKRVKSVAGVVDEFDGVTQSGPEIELKVDKQQAAAVGMTPESVSAAVNAAMYGDVVTTIVQNGERQIPVRVWSQGKRQEGLASLQNLQIATPSGTMVPLATLAKIERTEGSTETERQGLRPMLAVTAQLSGRDLGSAIQDIQSQLKTLSLPPGYIIEYGGQYESQQESFQQLLEILGVVIVLVFLVMLFYFRSFEEPVALFVAAIASLSGVVLALSITHTPLNIGSITGAIMIIGIVTENGIFLFDYTRQLAQREKMPLDELLVYAGKVRLRPKLMTILTAILTLFPLALGIGAGAELQRPLAIAVIGGLSMSTLFTLVLAPALYSALWGKRYQG